MDFFEHQDFARRQTRRLIILFILAVAAIIVTVHLFVTLLIWFASNQDAVSQGGVGSSYWDSLCDPLIFLSVGLTTTAVVSTGSLFKVSMLRGGGQAVALMMGGRLLNAGETNAYEQRLLNVVEEMAIASGSPVPPVFVMDQEPGVNAFAAGYGLDDAVISVSRGGLELLNRDQLQGVVAHEFSHILNGDMRLNIRLIGLVHGVLIIGLIGGQVLRSMRYMGRSRSSRSGKGGGGAILFILALGVGLLVIGFVGTLFGGLIKAAISRQREFLADASAVQFTRNPGGIAGALKTIGGFSTGAAMAAPQAAEISHMFFANGLNSFWGQWFATHPPLDQRIRRIDPSFDGQYPTVVASPTQQAPAGAMGLAESTSTSAVAALTQVHERMTDPWSVGRPSTAALAHAKSLLATIPDPLHEAAREPFGARAVVLTLLINRQAETQAAQWAAIEQHAEPPVYELTRRLAPLAQSLESRLRLPLMDITLPALRSMSRPQYERFMVLVDHLVQADNRIDLFEWMLQRLLHQHLTMAFTNMAPSGMAQCSLKLLTMEISTLLSTLAYAGQHDEAQARRAFDVGGKRLGLAEVRLLSRRDCGLQALGRALDALNQTTGLHKRRLLNAASAVITADQRTTVAEAELFRAVADSLGCPVSPLWADQTTK